MAKRKPAVPEKIVRHVGDPLTIRDHILTKIVAVHPFGTVDVVTEKGNYFRVTGLPIYRF